MGASNSQNINHGDTCIATGKTKSVTTMFENVLELDFSRHKRWYSTTFYGYSAHDGDSKLSWHYFINRTGSDSNSPQSFVISAVTDSCSTMLKASIEVSVNGGRTSCAKIIGYTISGSTLGTVEIPEEKFRQYIANRYTEPSIIFTFKVSFKVGSAPVEPAESKIQKHFTSLFTNEQLADVTILVGERTFYAHRAILSVRSAVFAAMFQSGMQETTLNRITVEEIEPEVFQEVLRYIYAGRVEGLDRLAGELLAAAEKYALDDLREMCENQLSKFTEDSVLETLVLADLYGASKLKNQAIQFICKNIKTLSTAQWEVFCSGYPGLAAVVFKAMTVEKEGNVEPKPQVPFHLSR